MFVLYIKKLSFDIYYLAVHYSDFSDQGGAGTQTKSDGLPESSRGDGARNMGKARQLEFIGKSTREERTAQRELQRSVESPSPSQILNSVLIPARV